MAILPRFCQEKGDVSDQREEFRFQLGQAVSAAERAIQILEEPGAPKRSFIYRAVLAKAFQILLGLYGLEQQRKAIEEYGPTE